ncbi:hypothetical protein ABVK25_003026 [Lepraria finkii]|uniref:O-methyltransferase C-terminal domain-containing protein n=1 Tax=Lepraria finkii TaxID=1340010 RepID=A0ABR4BFM2_9LECA
MQQDSDDPTKLESLLEIIQKDVKALKAGDLAARTRLVDRIAQLQRAVETPAERTFKMRFAFLQQFAIRILIENGTFTTLCAKGDPKITTEELSQATGGNKLLIERLMRLLAAVGVIDEIAENTYKPNAVTHFMNQPGFIGAEKHHFDLHTSVGVRMIEYMRTGAGVEQFNDEPGKQPPWEYSHNGKSFWKSLEEDPECKQDFDLYMAARRQGDLVPEWFQLYPVGQELVPTTGNNVRSLKTGKDDVLFVDVAGGLGHDVTKFRAYFPQLPGRCVLQDLPKTIAQVRKNPPQGVELMEYDFFTPQPVKGARIYFFRNIAHDWSDLRCSEIFSHTIAAMDKEYSRILFEDFVLPSTGATYRSASMDVHMLFSLAGIERTEGHWRELLRGLGLEIVKIWSDGIVEHEAVIEARKA